MSEHYYDGRETKQVAVCDFEGHVLSVRDHYAIAALNGIVGNSQVAKMLSEMKQDCCNQGMTPRDFEEKIEYPAYAKAAAAIAEACMKERRARNFDECDTK